MPPRCGWVGSSSSPSSPSSGSASPRCAAKEVRRRPRPAAAAEVTVADLLADPGAYAASEITLTGELVGDFQRRGEAVWTQLNDDAYVTAPLHAGGSLSGT